MAFWSTNGRPHPRLRSGSSSNLYVPPLAPQISNTVYVHVPPPRFAWFLKLPQELRDIIWGFALPGPRYIEARNEDFVTGSYTSGPFREGGKSSIYPIVKSQLQFNLGTPSQRQLLSILSTCQESRMVALKGTTALLPLRHRIPTYINYNTDTIVIKDQNCRSSWSRFHGPLKQGGDAIREMCKFQAALKHLVLQRETLQLDLMDQFSLVTHVAFVVMFSGLETLQIPLPEVALDEEKVKELCEKAVELVGEAWRAKYGDKKPPKITFVEDAEIKALVNRT